MSPKPALSVTLNLLSKGSREWVVRQKWEELRPIQEKTIPRLLAALRHGPMQDFVVSGPTASGKTEAVFLPLATILEEDTADPVGAQILYICPLNALIDQQATRLRGLFDGRRHPITPWHGRASRKGKDLFERAPSGVLIITPESLESQLLHGDGDRVHRFYGALRCIVVDEFHAFFNNPRGYQLLSQLNRLELLSDRGPVPRLALSATFNEQTRDEIQRQLRPAEPGRVEFIEDHDSRRAITFKVSAFLDGDGRHVAGARGAADAIAGQAFADFCRLGTAEPSDGVPKGLIFVNARQQVELYAQRLGALAQERGEPVEFLPHYSSLSPEKKREAEAALRDPGRSVVVVCTPTLELGIDIGAITQIGQVDPTSTVSSLHQRLGRSGRRHGQLGRLVAYVRDSGPARPSGSPLVELHLPTFQTLAQISLVQKKAYEPPDRRPAHLSTLVQQILSLAAQNGGWTSLAEVRSLLVDSGPFETLRRVNDPDDHLALLFARLEIADLLERRDHAVDRFELTLRARGLMRHHSFFAAFQTADEYTVYSSEGMLGKLPVGDIYKVGDRIIYAGKLWTIVAITRENRTLRVVPAATGQAPIFPGDPIPPSQAVLTEMQDLYEGTAQLPEVELDPTAETLFREGLAHYRRLGMPSTFVVEDRHGVLLFPWLDQRGQLSLTYALRYWGLNAAAASVAVFVENAARDLVMDVLRGLADGTRACPAGPEAIRNAGSALIDKHDHLLSPYLQRWNAATFRLDMDGVPETARRLL